MLSQTQIWARSTVVGLNLSIDHHNDYLGKEFRHGDVEGILAELAKATGHVGGGGGLLDFAQSVLSAATSGSKFSKEEVKRVLSGSIL